MVQMTIEMPEGVLAALREDPASFVRELRLAAAVKWYEMRRISQGRAAEIAGVSRSEFIIALGRFGISPFQSSAEEIIEEAEHGPRISRLGHYFAAKAKGLCPPRRFEPLLRQDVAEQLNRFQDIRLLQLKTRASYADILAQADEDLGNAFKAAARAGGAEELEIILKPPAYSRGRLADRLLSAVKHLVRREDLRSEVSRFVVNGLNTATEQVDLVDVLSDLLIAKKQVSLLEDNRSRALNPMSAYNAIEEAYSELKDQLSVAAGVDR